MTPEIVILLAKQKVKTAGFENYVAGFKDYLLTPDQELTVDCQNATYFVLDSTDSEIVVSSKKGIYNVTSNKTNMVCHEHTGKVKIHNTNGTENKRIQFLTVIYVSQDKLSKP